MNVKLLRDVQKFLLDEPRRFDMTNWVTDANSSEASPLKMPPCGTVCCIAGAAYVIGKKVQLDHTTIKYISDDASQLLDLTFPERERLYYTNGWPYKFKRAYTKAKTPLQRAKVGVARIEHFIKTKGAE